MEAGSGVRLGHLVGRLAGAVAGHRRSAEAAMSGEGRRRLRVWTGEEGGGWDQRRALGARSSGDRRTEAGVRVPEGGEAGGEGGAVDPRGRGRRVVGQIWAQKKANGGRLAAAGRCDRAGVQAGSGSGRRSAVGARAPGGRGLATPEARAARDRGRRLCGGGAGRGRAGGTGWEGRWTGMDGRDVRSSVGGGRWWQVVTRRGGSEGGRHGRSALGRMIWEGVNPWFCGLRTWFWGKAVNRERERERERETERGEGNGEREGKPGSEPGDRGREEKENRVPSRGGSRGGGGTVAKNPISNL